MEQHRSWSRGDWTRYVNQQAVFSIVHLPRSDEHSVRTLLRIACSRPYLKLKPHYRFDNEIQSGLQISHAAVPDRGNTDYSRGREAMLDVCGGPTAVSTLAGFINALQMTCRYVQYGIWTTVLSHQATQVPYCVYMGIRSNCIMMMITLDREIFPNQANGP